MLKSKVISIGDEILIGQIVNSNAAFICEKLYAAGMPAEKIITIGDTEDALKAELDESIKNYSITVITGGLGPTHDDLTKPVMVKYFKNELITDKKVLNHIEDIFARRDMEMPGINKEQAKVPKDSKVIWNNHGTAPGIWIEKEGKIFIALPGVPYEMKAMMDEVISMLKERFSKQLEDVYKNKILLTTGISESGLYELLGDIEEITNGSKLAFLPSGVGVRLRIDVREKTEEAADEKIKEIERKILKKAGKYTYGTGDETLESITGKSLKEKNLKLAVAESCTGGLLSSTIVSIPGSSVYYRGGACTYSNDAKIKVLGVKKETIDKFGAVSEETAKEMAEGARKIYDADTALSTTGIAGPDGGNEEKPVGLVWIGYSDKNKTYAKKYLFGKERERNIQRSVNAALEMLRKELLEN